MQHCIIAKFNEGVTDKKSLCREISQLFHSCLDIPGVHGVRCIENLVDRPNRYDLMIAIHMEPEALEAYDHCQAHHVWKRDYAHLLASKAIFDGDF